MPERPIVRYFIVATALVGGVSALANETQTYTYDDLGRLVEVAYSGTINAGNKHSMCYDSTDNRTRYRSDPAGAGVTCPEPVPVPTPTPTPTPTPPPPPTNNPPVTNTDSVSLKVCETASKIVTANDTDLDGDYPLTVTAVGTTSLADVYIISGSSIGVGAYGTTGSGTVTYTIMDSRGATASGFLNITVTSGNGCQ